MAAPFSVFSVGELHAASKTSSANGSHLNAWGFDISAAEFPQQTKTRVFGVNRPLLLAPMTMRNLTISPVGSKKAKSVKLKFVITPQLTHGSLFFEGGGGHNLLYSGDIYTYQIFLSLKWMYNM